MSEFIKFDVTDMVAIITLNRPEKLNAFTDNMLMALVDAIDRCELDNDIRCVILTGEGRGFSAGGDVTQMGKDADNHPKTTKHHVTDYIQAFPRRLANFKLSLIHI